MVRSRRGRRFCPSTESCRDCKSVWQLRCQPTEARCFGRKISVPPVLRGVNGLRVRRRPLQHTSRLDAARTIPARATLRDSRLLTSGAAKPTLHSYVDFGLFVVICAF